MQKIELNALTWFLIISVWSQTEVRRQVN